jgi:hypothetical protein
MRTLLVSVAALLALSGTAAAQAPSTAPDTPGATVPGSTAGTGSVGAPLRDTTGATPLGNPGISSGSPPGTAGSTGATGPAGTTGSGSAPPEGTVGRVPTAPPGRAFDDGSGSPGTGVSRPSGSGASGGGSSR